MADITEQLEALMQTGSEAEVKQFILDHIKEFPEEAQRAFAMGIFEDALSEQAASAQEVMRMRDTVKEALDAIESGDAQA